ncbi:PhoH family protein [Paenibacillus naphthalenovorans]|uniref:PhoH family protein n=1 Tax=Paenibacillus naphthalenovorans TaxID=162209 RepID=UPI003D27B4A3
MAYWGVTSRNTGQAAALRALANDKPFTFLTGPAGCGKTLLAQAVGLSRVEGRNFRKFVYTRLPTQLGEGVGFLPGDLNEKTYPFLRPFFDNLDVMTSDKRSLIEQYAKGDEDRRKVFFDPIQTLRGGTFHDAYVLVDEIQNLDVHTMLGVGTRPGDRTKIVFCGNFAQIDNEKLRRPERNGFYRLLAGLYEHGAHEYFDHVNLTQVERHPVVELVERILRNNEVAPEFEALEARGSVN